MNNTKNIVNTILISGTTQTVIANITNTLTNMNYNYFIIGGPIDEGEQLYWSNTDGWVDKASATKFNDIISLPIESTFIEFIK